MKHEKSETIVPDDVSIIDDCLPKFGSSNGSLVRTDTLPDNRVTSSDDKKHASQKETGSGDEGKENRIAGTHVNGGEDGYPRKTKSTSSSPNNKCHMAERGFKLCGVVQPQQVKTLSEPLFLEYRKTEFDGDDPKHYFGYENRYPLVDEGDEYQSEDDDSEDEPRSTFSYGVYGDIKPIIALPPPSLGIACGGNQSFQNAHDTIPTEVLQPQLQAGAEWNSGTNSVESTVSSARTAGDVGLLNHGNTCFMNAGLQCLLHTPPVVKFFIQHSNQFNCSSGNSIQLLKQFQRLIMEAWMGSNDVLTLTEFKSVLGQLQTQFNDGRQHDCQEFLAVTLDALHEQLRICQKNEGPTVNIKEPSYSAPPADGPSLAPINKVELKAAQKKLRIRNTFFGKVKPPIFGNAYGQSVSKESRWLSFQQTSSRFYNISKRTLQKCLTTSSLSNHTELPVSRNDAKRPKLELGAEAMDTDNVQDSLRTNGDYHHTVADNSLSPTKATVRKTVSDSVAHVNGVDENLNESSMDTNDPKVAADEFWEKHISSNNTVIANTFQGVYKSTVTCSVCNFVSITHEPFMYLSLPIPRVLDCQLKITYISHKARQPEHYELTMQLVDTVQKLKQLIGEKFDAEPSNLLVTEVWNYKIYRPIERKATRIRELFRDKRNIYVYELNENFQEKYGKAGEYEFDSVAESEKNMNPSTYLSEDWDADTPPVSSTVSSSSDVYGILPEGNETKPSTWIQCTICLEEFWKQQVKVHSGCSCFLCDGCIQSSVKYFLKDNPDQDVVALNTLKCAVCSLVVNKDSFISVGNTSGDLSPKILILPLLFRSETTGSSLENFQPNLFGYPLMIRVPSQLPASELMEFLGSLHPTDVPIKYLTTDKDGKWCANCPLSSHCTGCQLSNEGLISLNPNYAIVISYDNLSCEEQSRLNPPDMMIEPKEYQGSMSHSKWSSERDEPIIDIHDCLKAFSEIENLDEQNPWHCPRCEQNRCATKALSICRLPDYLIVYLKRFVFVDQSSNKLNNRLKFPVTDLDVSPYISDESGGKGELSYDLYSCVCHFGGAYSGHYTAFGKNPNTKAWNYFNDSFVEARTPDENQYMSAYILFYERKGSRSFDDLLPPSLNNMN